jgi:pimeloyl-ACP methyl ester carboxylesterase
VIELQRALDLLLARPEVDASRVALVGHDYGAMHGIVAAAVDSRVKTCVFIAAAPSFNDWAFFAKKPASMDDYLKQNAPLDLLAYAPRLAGRPVFLQFAREDEYVPIPRADAFFAALREPRRIQIYDGAHHEMTAPAAIREDRTAWLVEKLGLE